MCFSDHQNVISHISIKAGKSLESTRQEFIRSPHFAVKTLVAGGDRLKLKAIDESNEPL